jgi:hypothetical protein
MSFKAIDNCSSRLAIVACIRTDGELLYVAVEVLSFARCVVIIDSLELMSVDSLDPMSFDSLELKTKTSTLG